MAAFYTYRHVELDRVGCGKRKVLKPPGGGSSNIFGGQEDGNKLPASNPKKFGGASTLVLGEPDEAVAQVDRKMSAASLDAADGASVSSQTSSTSNGTPDNSEPNTPRSGTPLLNGPIAYDNHTAPLPTPSRPQGRRAQGNPVTGVGYNPEEEKKEETPRRQRVPPGGYSSKLW